MMTSSAERFGELGMRIDRDAAAVVAHGDRAVGLEADLDPAGVAGDRLVHRIVEQLGDQMVQRPLVGAADEHPRPPPDRLEPLQHLDVGGGIVGRRAGRARLAPGRDRSWLAYMPGT